MFTAASLVVPLAIPLTSLPPALMPSVVIEIGVPPAGVTVTPVGAVVVELPAASVVVTPPLETTVELPAASEMVQCTCPIGYNTDVACCQISSICYATFNG